MTRLDTWKTTILVQRRGFLWWFFVGWVGGVAALDGCGEYLGGGRGLRECGHPLETGSSTPKYNPLLPKTPPPMQVRVKRLITAPAYADVDEDDLT